MDIWKLLTFLKQEGIFSMALHDFTILYKRKFQAYYTDFSMALHDFTILYKRKFQAYYIDCNEKWSKFYFIILFESNWEWQLLIRVGRVV